MLKILPLTPRPAPEPDKINVPVVGDELAVVFARVRAPIVPIPDVAVVIAFPVVELKTAILLTDADPRFLIS